jgi:hypothetical protein
MSKREKVVGLKRALAALIGPCPLITLLRTVATYDEHESIGLLSAIILPQKSHCIPDVVQSLIPCFMVYVPGTGRGNRQVSIAALYAVLFYFLPCIRGSQRGIRYDRSSV